MANIVPESSSVLGIELGSIHTRALLFDVVDGSYHFIGSGIAQSTFAEPFKDIGEGVFDAITQLQDITGRMLLDKEGNLILPGQAGGEGVDRLVISVSCGPDLKIVTMGLLNEVSVESANRLARTTYATIVDSLGINDRRPIQAQIDSLLAAQPELILFAGGTNFGATRSLDRMTQMIASTLQLIPKDERPRILFCGNPAVLKQVKEILGKFTVVQSTDNIRPKIDIEDIDKPTADLAALVIQKRLEQIGGLQRVTQLASEAPILGSIGFERIIRFLGKQYDPAKGVLGIDIGASHTIVSYANSSHSSVSVLPIGTGEGVKKLVQKQYVTEIEKWLLEPTKTEDIESYLLQRVLFPASIPADTASLNIELALSRLILRLSILDLESRGGIRSRCFEPIIVGGTVLTHTATPQQVLLALLDGIQPRGIVPLILDKHGILASLGAIAKIIPLLAVQVLESTAFVNLATTVTVESSAHEGSVLLKARLQYTSGSYQDAEIKQGSIASFPLATGETGLLHLKRTRRCNIEEVEISDQPIKVNGGICGVVIDARGRPLLITDDISKRQEQYKKWMFILGGQ